MCVEASRLCCLDWKWFYTRFRNALPSWIKSLMRRKRKILHPHLFKRIEIAYTCCKAYWWHGRKDNQLWSRRFVIPVLFCCCLLFRWSFGSEYRAAKPLSKYFCSPWICPSKAKTCTANVQEIQAKYVDMGILCHHHHHHPYNIIQKHHASPSMGFNSLLMHRSASSFGFAPKQVSLLWK